MGLVANEVLAGAWKGQGGRGRSDGHGRSYRTRTMTLEDRLLHGSNAQESGELWGGRGICELEIEVDPWTIVRERKIRGGDVGELVPDDDRAGQPGRGRQLNIGRGPDVRLDYLCGSRGQRGTERTGCRSRAQWGEEVVRDA